MERAAAPSPALTTVESADVRAPGVCGFKLFCFVVRGVIAHMGCLVDTRLPRGERVPLEHNGGSVRT